MIAAALLLAGAVAAASPAKRPLTPDMVRREIARYGVDRFVGLSYDHRIAADWPIIMDHIERGEAEWMPIARELARMEAPAAPAEELDTALALGLSRAPQNVLPLLSVRNSGRMSIGVICGAPIPAPGKPWLIRYKARTLKALQAVGDARLAARKAACISTLRAVDTSQSADSYE